MVLVGFFCVLGAIGLLIAGLVRSDPDLVWSSIGASAVGGLAIVVASIQRGRAARSSAGPAETDTDKDQAASSPTAEPTTVVTPVLPRRTPGSALATIPIASTADAIKDPPTPAATVPEPAVPEPKLPDAGKTVPAVDKPAKAALPDELPPDDAEHSNAVVDDVVITDLSEASADPSDSLGAGSSSVPDPDVESAEGAEPYQDPPDEPDEEDVDMADLLTVIDLDSPVFVVDLRPRYHLENCAHLRGREAVPIPLNEAREDGFTPCARCRPDAFLAAAARQLRAAPEDATDTRHRPGPA